MIRRLSASQLAQIALKQPDETLSLRNIHQADPSLPPIPGYAHEVATQLPHSDSFGDRAAIGIEGALRDLPPVSRYIPNGDAFGQSFVRGLASGFAEPRLANMAESAQTNLDIRKEADERNKMRMADEQDASKESRQFGYNLQLHRQDAETRAAQDEAAFKRQQDAEATRFRMEHDPNLIRRESAARAEGTLAGGGTQLDPAALLQQAIRYARTGNPGPLPRGPAGGAYLTALNNKVAELYPHLDMARKIAEFKGNSASYAKLRAGTDQVASMETTALSNSKLVEQTMAKIPDTGTEIGNAIFRPALKALGSSDITDFNNALGTVQKEFARILNSGMSGNAVLSDDARKDLAAAAGQNFTKKQLSGALNIYRQDAHNRRTSQESQLQDILKRIDEGTDPNETTSTPATGGSHFVWTSDGHGNDVAKEVAN